MVFTRSSILEGRMDSLPSVRPRSRRSSDLFRGAGLFFCDQSSGFTAPSRWGSKIELPLPSARGSILPGRGSPSPDGSLPALGAFRTNVTGRSPRAGSGSRCSCLWPIVMEVGTLIGYRLRAHGVPFA